MSKLNKNIKKLDKELNKELNKLSLSIYEHEKILDKINYNLINISSNSQFMMICFVGLVGIVGFFVTIKIKEL